MYFESHAHYDDKRFKDDQDELLKSLKDFGVSYVVNSAADMKSCKKSIELSNKYDFVYCAIGVHPHAASELNDEKLQLIKNYTLEKKVVAIGEIGLDFFYDHSPRDTQRLWFKRQLELATEVNLPVIIHSREADGETFDILKEYKNDKKGVIHCYSGSKEMAAEYIKRGFYIGVGGVITFNNARRLVETVEAISLESILIETDCPYLAPIPHRGERNDSRYLKYVVQKIAEVKNISPEEVAKVTMENGKKLFSI